MTQPTIKTVTNAVKSTVAAIEGVRAATVAAATVAADNNPPASTVTSATTEGR